MKAKHEKKVAKLQATINHRTAKLSLKSLNSNTLRDSNRKKIWNQIDLSSFDQIIHIEDDFALVEPRVTIEKLCKETLKKGLIPPVVPEFKSITVGGAIMGAALESSSFRYGQFNDICLEYELILGCGTLIIASPDQNSDLFYGISGSYGTLALLTLVKIQLIRAKKYVHLKYQKFANIDSLLDFFAKNSDSDFLEGIALSQNQIIGIKAVMTNEKKAPLYRHSLDWFISHLTEAKEEIMSLKKYLFRFDRGAFWMGYFILSFSLFLRVFTHFQLKRIKIKPTKVRKPSFFLSLFFSSRWLYRLWHRVPKNVKENLFFIQDFYTPLSKAQDFFQTLNLELNLFPLWICPLKATNTPQILSPHYLGENLVNIGVYGIPNHIQPIPKLTADFEKKILDMGGKKMLYSLTYYDEKTFDLLINREKYQKLREKFHAEKAFPTLYNKIVSHESENLHIERPSHPQ